MLGVGVGGHQLRVQPLKIAFSEMVPVGICGQISSKLLQLFFA